MSTTSRDVFSVSVLGCAAALTIGILYSHHTPTPESDVADRPNVVLGDRYVSSNTCRACHPRQYDSWHRSFHRTMTQVAAPQTIVPDFDGVVVSAVRGRPMRLERRGEEFWADFDDPDSPVTPRRILRQVVMTTGSHEQQQFWYATDRNRLVSKLPAIYLIAEKRWIPRQAAFLHPPDDPAGSDTGAWNAVCIACHTTSGKPQIDTPFGFRPALQQEFDSHVAEFGIACEACHGPAEEHVRLNRRPDRRYTLHLTNGTDPTIVDPRRLPPQRSSEVCGQCHGIWEFYNVAGERQANQSGLPYRPGDELRDTRFVAQPTSNIDSETMKEILADDPRFVTDSFWSDGMVRVSGREYNGLIESPCYRNSHSNERTLTCSSCHTLHKQDDDPRAVNVWADTHQMSLEHDNGDACLQCHQRFRQNLAAHTKHRSAEANNCYNCHMPYTSYGLLRALRSHQISSPTATASVVTGRPNACNLCHLDKTLQWTADYLQSWYRTPRPALDEDERTISASLLWLLRGDAGQRALIAWGMSWPPALQASGRTWMAPFLAQLLDDPYDAVRLIAARSLRQLPGFSAFPSFPYDFISSADVRKDAVAHALSVWRANSSNNPKRTAPELLFDADGRVNVDAVRRLLKLRNDRRLALRE
jgi:hypothetical protein